MWALSLLGAALVILVLREVFHTLLHPGGQGWVSMFVFRSVWGGAHRLGNRAMALAGPTALSLVIALWAGGLIAGWALVYWPFMPDGFIFASPLDPENQGSFADALYLSWVTQATLGYGDIAPEENALRMLAPLQATLGFALFTAAVTWVLSIYPALGRRRSAATLLHGFRIAAERVEATGDNVHPTTLARRLHAMADAVSSARVDLAQYPETFYFAPPNEPMSLASELPYAVSLSRRDNLGDEAQTAAAELAVAIEEFISSIGSEHLQMEEAEIDEVLRAYRRHEWSDDAET